MDIHGSLYKIITCSDINTAYLALDVGIALAGQNCVRIVLT